jgi:hypothetical protein
MPEIQPALLTRAEIDWLLGNKEVSKLYERKIRCLIKKKIETLTELEIPLLLDRGFNVTTYSNGVTTSSNTSGLGGNLVGRGIADPDEQVNEVRENNLREKRGEWEFRSISRNFEPTCPFGHGISNPTPYQARRPPQLLFFVT